ncbi:LysM peptidoglycan-binding domain-containing protein [Anaerofustis stercorihominis]|uniref:LysM peptidoglycan-binding domain-containing protein n=1 Tax=Anaerofustis stercorihominis TaxID=214853 RepID=UPI003984396A
MTNYEYNVYRNKQKRIERAKRKRALRRKRRIMISALILAVLISVPTFFYSAKAKTLHQDTYPVYTVQANDTLWDIAKNITDDSTDVRQTIYEIGKLNDIDENQSIEVGQRILLPY